MQIRSYDEVDPFEIQKLTWTSFGWAMEERWIRTLRRKDPRYFDDYAVYATERGKPLAQVVPMKMTVRLASGPEEVGGLQAVCSHPSMWGRGLVRRLTEHVHDRFRAMGLRVSTLTTSRNIRGYHVYRGLGYVDLAPFDCGSRRIPRDRGRPDGLRVRKATKADLPTIQRLFEAYTRGLCGWTERHPRVLPAIAAWYPRFLERYRIAERDGTPVGYFRTDPNRDRMFEEMIAPRATDFRDVVAWAETRARGKVAATTWITCAKDRTRLLHLGYDLDGPIGDTTMAVPLERSLRPRGLPALFGATSGRFAHYPSDDF